jgi:hypothetical protein
MSKDEPSLWLGAAMVRAVTSSRTAPLRLVIQGHGISLVRLHSWPHKDSRPGAPQASEQTWLASTSGWLAPILHEYELGNEPSHLAGSLDLLPSASGFDPSGGVLSWDLLLSPRVECVVCGERFRTQPLIFRESYRLETAPSLPMNDGQGPDDDTTTDEHAASGDLLDVVDMDTKGLALDALLLDAICLAAPDHPRCVLCSTETSPVAH